MVEINEAEKKKELKEMRTTSETSWKMLNTPTFETQEPQNKKTKKYHEKILKEIIVENFTKMGKEIPSQIQEIQSPKQDKPKMKHPKTYINQISKDQTQRTNIKSSKGKITNNTQGNSHKDNS